LTANLALSSEKIPKSSENPHYDDVIRRVSNMERELSINIKLCNHIIKELNDTQNDLVGNLNLVK